MSELTLSDPEEIRPRRPIQQKEIDQLLKDHWDLQKGSLFLLERAFEIGFRLRCWHDLLPHGQWLKWLEKHIPQISERTITNYLRLWDNNEWLRTKFPNQQKIADLSEIPTVRDALTLIQAKDANKPRGAPPKRKVGVTIQKRDRRTAGEQAAALAVVAQTAGAVLNLPLPVQEIPVEVVPNKESPNAETFLPAAVEPEEIDDETNAAHYCATDLKQSAPHFWARLCPRCRAILEGRRDGVLQPVA
jgi:hypothetical protein